MKNFPDAKRNRGGTRGNWIEGLEPRAYFAVDLSAVVSFVSPPSHEVKPGHAFAISIEVFNNGDATAAGKLTGDLSYSPNADGSSPVAEVALGRNIHLKAGAHATFRVSEKVPLGFTPGNYYAALNVDPNNTFGETNLNDKMAVSSNTLAVLSLYPDVLGTFVGSGVIKKGFEKGLAFTQSVTTTTEDNATGILTFEGTDLFSNGVTVSFSGTTIVKPNGSYVANGQDDPQDNSIFIKDIGRYIGNKSKGTFATAINSGIYNDTLEG